MDKLDMIECAADGCDWLRTSLFSRLTLEQGVKEADAHWAKNPTHREFVVVFINGHHRRLDLIEHGAASDRD